MIYIAYCFLELVAGLSLSVALIGASKGFRLQTMHSEKDVALCVWVYYFIGFTIHLFAGLWI